MHCSFQAHFLFFFFCSCFVFIYQSPSTPLSPAYQHKISKNKTHWFNAHYAFDSHSQQTLAEPVLNCLLFSTVLLHTLLFKKHGSTTTRIHYYYPQQNDKPSSSIIMHLLFISKDWTTPVMNDPDSNKVARASEKI